MNRVFSSRNIIVLVLMLGIISCSKKTETTPFVAVGDVYYVNKNIDDKKQTALAFYAYGDKAITSATANIPGGGTVNLDESKNSSYTVFKEPKNEDFSDTYPEAGTYTFNIVSSDGDQLQSPDVLRIENLEIPEITEIKYEDIDTSYDITWKEINNAEGFLVKLFDAQSELVFTSDELGSGATSFTLIQDYEGIWEKQIIVGDTYTISLHAFIYDADANGTNNMFNVEELSITETDFVWDEK